MISPIPTVEKLESRRLLAASAVLAPDGTLTVTGTNDADSINIQGDNDIWMNSRDFYIYGSVQRIKVEALGGDDDVFLSEYANVPVKIDLGAGNDDVGIANNYGNIVGGPGNDTVGLWEEAVLNSFDGGPGVDSIELTGSTTDVPVDLPTFPTVENVIDAHASVTGNALNNYIALAAPFAGSDSDTQFVSAGDGNDTVVGGYGPTWFDGGRGDDMFVAGVWQTGSTVIGGSGNDTVDYSRAQWNVTVDLTRGIGGLATYPDRLTSVENATGGSGDDTLIGDDHNNILSGGAGNDTITGNGGKDLLIGGTGNDTFYAQDKKRDTVQGDDGTDTAYADKQDKLIDVEVVVR